MSISWSGARKRNASTFRPLASGRVRSTAWPSTTLPNFRSAMSSANGGSLAGSMSLAPACTRAGAAAAPGAAGSDCQCTRSSWPLMVPPSALGTVRRPASDGPSRRTSSACGPGCSCSRVCSNTPPISLSWPTCTSTARSGIASSSLPPRARLIHSSASRVGLRPLTVSPLAGGSRSTWSLPSVTCTPVWLLWLRAARARRWPKATSMRPAPIGSCAATVVASGSEAGLSSGAGRSSRVPTRSELSRSSLGGAGRLAPPWAG